LFQQSALLLVCPDRGCTNTSNGHHQVTPKKEHRRKKRKRKCDIFSGEWIPNPKAPYYTNTTCRAIHEHQNCIKYGRPDLGFMKWRWKPKECDLPLFDPYEFLEIVRGTRMAFVGDSVSRNHVQSLICLLSRVPILSMLIQLFYLFYDNPYSFNTLLDAKVTLV